MPKRRRFSRARSYPRRRYRAFRRGKAPIPLLPVIGFAAGLITAKPEYGNWSSPLEAFQDGNIPVAAQSLIANLTGIEVGIPGTGYVGPPVIHFESLINPFDLSSAAAVKGLLLGSLGSMLMTKIGANRQIRKVPFIGKFIKL